MYKMLVLDIDGTLIDDNGKIPFENHEKIKSLVERNIPVCLCTGRSLTHAWPIIKELDIKTPCICLDGGLMYDVVEEKIIFDQRLSVKEVEDIMEIALKHDVYIEIATKDNYNKYIKHDLLNCYDFFDVRDMAHAVGGVYHESALDILEACKNDIVLTIVVAGVKADLDNISLEIEKLGNKELEIRKLVAENYLFISSVKSYKSEGVKLLCNHYGIDIKEVVAIGDSGNDIDMIEQVGMGVAVGNATDKLKEVADFVAKRNNEAGVAQVIDMFFK